MTDSSLAATPPCKAGAVMVVARKGAALTDRERLVLAGAARGRTNAQIARRLGITEDTVKSHMRHILSKLDVPNRAAATTAGFVRGILQLPISGDIDGAVEA